MVVGPADGVLFRVRKLGLDRRMMQAWADYLDTLRARSSRSPSNTSLSKPSPRDIDTPQVQSVPELAACPDHEASQLAARQLPDARDPWQRLEGTLARLTELLSENVLTRSAD